jgi:hypothetical protein
LKHVLTHVRVECGQRVIKHDEIRARINCSCDANPLFLTAAQVDPFFTNLRFIS